MKLNSDLVDWREIDGEIIAVDLQTAEYLSLNDSATMLWHALAQGSTREQMVALLQSAYGVNKVTAVADVDVFLATMDQRGLLRHI